MRMVVSLTAAVVGVAFLTQAALGADTPVKATKQWTGSVKDANLAKNAPTVITSAKQLEKLWKDWKIGDKAPDVDFTKEIVVVATTVGSNIKLSCALDDKGNLKLIGIGTDDFGDGFRYVIQSVNREGVKMVDGKELPKD
jgi:hypothetical protein